MYQEDHSSASFIRITWIINKIKTVHKYEFIKALDLCKSAISCKYGEMLLLIFSLPHPYSTSPYQVKSSSENILDFMNFEPPYLHILQRYRTFLNWPPFFCHTLYHQLNPTAQLNSTTISWIQLRSWIQLLSAPNQLLTIPSPFVHYGTITIHVL